MGAVDEIMATIRQLPLPERLRLIERAANEWEAEIARRAERVRAGQSAGKPAGEVFDRLEAQLKSR